MPGARAAKLADCEKAGVLPARAGHRRLPAPWPCFRLSPPIKHCRRLARGAHAIAPGTLWLDMNRRRPGHQARRRARDRAGRGRYLDVAVMAPVFPRRLATPLLVSGPHCEDGVEAAARDRIRQRPGAGRRNRRSFRGEDDPIGARQGDRGRLPPECLLAAGCRGRYRRVIASLDAEWRARADYNLGRMMVHGCAGPPKWRKWVRTLESLGRGALRWRAAPPIFSGRSGGWGWGQSTGSTPSWRRLGRLPRDRARDPRHRLPRPLHRRLRRSTRHGATRRRQRSRPARRRRHIRPFPKTRFARRSSRTRSGCVRERGIDMTLFSAPRASAMAHHVGDENRQQGVGTREQRPDQALRRSLPRRVRGHLHAAAEPGGRARRLDRGARALRGRARLRSGRRAFRRPRAHRSLLVSALREAGRAKRARDDPRIGQLQSALHATGAFYIAADTIAFMQLVQGDLFADFPALASSSRMVAARCPTIGGAIAALPTCSASRRFASM